MGDFFLELLRFAVDTLGDLKSCNLYDERYANLELTTSDGKILKISMTIGREQEDA